MSVDPNIKDYMDERMGSCRREVESHISTVASDMHQLRSEFHALRSDMHRITQTVEEIATSLKMIAESVNKLSDLPDTWEKVKGFWSVMTWLRSNFFPAATLFVLVFYILASSGATDTLLGVLK